MTAFDRSKPVLVFLATGVQGSAVVRTALAQGLRVRTIVRSVAPDIVGKAGLLAPGVALVRGDLDDAGSLEAACAELDHAIVQVPTGPAPEMVSRARHAFTAFRRAGLRSVVLRLASASRPAPCPEPSFLANAAVEAVARESGVPFSLVRPTLYLDNLLKPSALADLRANGVFAPPIPAGQRIAWTSAEDCARAALLLIERNASGEDHRIAGAQSLTGDALAAELTLGLGRPIRYQAQPLDAFEGDVDAALGTGMGRVVASKFRYLADNPEEAERILATPFRPHGALTDFRPADPEGWVRRHRQALLGD